MSNDIQNNQDSFEEINESSDILDDAIDSNLTRPECQLKTISLEEYEYLKGLPTQVQKLKRRNQKMRSVIQNKNAIIESMKKEMKRNQNLLNMSTVSKHILLHILIICTYF